MWKNHWHANSKTQHLQPKAPHHRLPALPGAQAAKLYTETGQFNPHAARAQRKQARKLQRRRVDTRSSGGAADDFDFAEAFLEVAVNSDDEDEEEQ